MISKLKYFTIDSFSKSPFEGNPAAVVFQEKFLDDNVMQKIAAEMNLSETAFLRPLASNSWSSCNNFSLRWMTPTNEVNLCGHATLASAHALFFEAGNTNDVLEFSTLSGTLKAQRMKEEIVLDFPLLPPSPLNKSQGDICAPLVQKCVGLLKIHELSYSETAKKLLIRLEDNHTRSDLEKLSPQTDDLLKLHEGTLVKGIIITVKSPSGIYDFYSRYFAPWNGIPEDPVTGSAHSVLGPFWSSRLNKNELKCRQCSVRGGDLSLSVRYDGRIDIAGVATTVMEGNIRI